MGTFTSQHVDLCDRRSQELLLEGSSQEHVPQRTHQSGSDHRSDPNKYRCVVCEVLKLTPHPAEVEVITRKNERIQSKAADKKGKRQELSASQESLQQSSPTAFVFIPKLRKHFERHFSLVL